VGWRKLLRPTELLDIDGVAQLFVALSSGENENDLRHQTIADFPLVNAPLDTAVPLRAQRRYIASPTNSWIGYFAKLPVDIYPSHGARFG